MKTFITYVLNKLRNNDISKSTAKDLLQLIAGVDVQTKSVNNLHSVLHSNQSTFDNQQFCSSFLGNEFFFKDHKIGGQAVLPGVIQLEMAKVALENSLDYEQDKGVVFTNISWNSPFIKNNSTQLPKVYLTLSRDVKGSTVFEVYSSNEVSRITHSLGGIAQTGDTSREKIDLSQIKENCKQNTWSDKQCYSYFEDIDVLYGASFRGIKQIYSNDKEALAEIHLPDDILEKQQDFYLSPGILDAAMQATCVFKDNSEDNGSELYLPYSMDSIKVFEKLDAVNYVWVRKADKTMNGDGQKRYDIDLCDVHGNVLAQIIGFLARAFAVKEDSKFDTKSRANLHSSLDNSDNGSHENSMASFKEDGIKIEAWALDFFKQLFSGVSKVPVARLDSSKEFEDYGIDSLLIMKLTRELESHFGLLSKTLFYEYANLQEIVEYFLRDFRSEMETLYRKAFKKELSSSLVSGLPQRVIQEKKNFNGNFIETPAKSVVKQKIVKDKHTETDIAIIGLNGRYPKANTISEFWSVLKKGQDCITEIPKDRWDHTKFFDKNKQNSAGKSYSKWGGFLDDVYRFDPLFFKMSPSEAEVTDPQERLFLECAYSTIEDAGYSKSTLGSDVGVFVGAMYAEYPLLGIEKTMQGNPLILSGSYASIANRISYFFNFNGPSMGVDSMCSSSLASIHLACTSIRSGDCRLAVAGGVNLSLHPNKYLALAKGKFASSKGLCESFGEGGDGYVPGEGVGAVLLKKLSDAEADGDNIYGIVKGSALNHGGKTNGYSVPNPNAQAEVVLKAIKNAKVDPKTISYIEAHGTGTSLGDPIEIKGLIKSLGNGVEWKKKCAIGSVKSNIGHCEGAAGIAGLTKVLLQMRNAKLVPSLHSKTLNPNIDFKNSPVVVQQEYSDWDRPILEENGEEKEFPRIAGISSFGAGGANAHVIVQEYISKEADRTDQQSKYPAFIVLSAKNKKLLRVKVQELIGYFNEKTLGNKDVYNIAYTLQLGREEMPERLAFVVKDFNELRVKLESYLNDEGLNEQIFTARVENNAEAQKNQLLQAELDRDLSEGDFEGILGKWLGGGLIQWELLYAFKPKRISLPSYPFSKTRHCAIEPGFQPLNSVEQFRIPKLHPLVHQNKSNFAEQHFYSSYTGNEHFFKDHIVNGKKILPGVACLEMFRAAVNLALPGQVEDYKLQIKNSVWTQPCVSGNDGQHLHIILTIENNSEVHCTIKRNPTDESNEVICQGKVVLQKKEAQDIADLTALKIECTQNFYTADEVYKAFREIGIEYGESHRGIEELYATPTQALAKITLPEVVESTRSSYYLHPSIMDSALQTTMGLMLSSPEQQSAIPFALESLEVYSPCNISVWAWARYSKGISANDKVKKIDIDIMDGSGTICARLRGFSTRVIENKTESEVDETRNLLMLQATWENYIDPSSDFSRNFLKYHVIVCETGDWIKRGLCNIPFVDELVELKSEQENLGDRYEEYSLKLFEHIQGLIKSKSKGDIFLQLIVPNTPIKLLYSGLGAMLRTAQQEYPKLTCQLILIEEGEEGNIEQITSENILLADKNTIRYENGIRQVISWKEMSCIDKVEIPWKSKGTYFITGGLGGLGLVFVKEIIAQVDCPNLILCGRSELSNEQKEQLKDLSERGATLNYMKVDISKEQEMMDLIDTIKQQGVELNGIIHSAGIIEDSYILKKTTDQIQRVLAPKVKGLLNLDLLSKGFELDFMVLFSSVAGVLGSPGQVDYAAGNAFMDEFAAYRNQQVKAGDRSGFTLSINWPLWKDGGMQIDEVSEKMLWQNMGMIPMPKNLGIYAFSRALEAKKSQVLVMAGEKDRLKMFMNLDATNANSEIPPSTKELAQDEKMYYSIQEKIEAGDLSEEEFKELILTL